MSDRVPHPCSLPPTTTTTTAPPPPPPPPSFQSRLPPSSHSSRPPHIKRIMLAGDVMLGRGVDMILPHSCSPELYESCVKDARDYTQLAVDANGALPPAAERGYNYPWGFVLDDMEVKRPDVRIVNLETAVTTHDVPWPRKSINYRMHPGNVPTLTSAHIDICTLANNHTLDWNLPGLRETLTSLQAAGISTTGAGLTSDEATAPAVIELVHLEPSSEKGAENTKGIETGTGSVVPSTPPPVGSLEKSKPKSKEPDSQNFNSLQPPTTTSNTSPSTANTTKTSFNTTIRTSTATASTTRVLVWSYGHASSGVPPAWTATPSDPGIAFLPDLSRQTALHIHTLISSYKRPGDIVVFSVHWGSNWGYDVPEEQRDFARALIDLGAVDIVHGHSSHHIKGAEVYKRKLILYGCGDLISDYEGIRNASVQYWYPPEQYRDTVGAVWYVDIDTRDGSIVQLLVTPTKLRNLRLQRPSADDLEFVKELLARECGNRGAKAVIPVHDGSTSLIIQF